ncbi:MAG: tetratricopeptide repeat protein, partial [Bdellovibrionales bacterium]
QEDLSSDAFVEEDGDDMFAEQDALSVTVDGVADAEVIEEGGAEPDVELSMDAADIEPAPAIDDAVDVLSVDVEEDEVVSVDETPSYPAETTVVSGVAPSDMPSDMKAVEDNPAVIVVAEEEPIAEVSDELTVSPSEEVLIDIVDEQPVDGGNVGVPVKPEVYFDSVENVVQRDSSLQAVGPSEVDPIAEPASKYLVVSDVKPKNSIESQIQQARRALKLGRYDAAYDFYERLYKKSPKDEAILMGRAVSLQKLGRETAAISAYEELLNLYPKNADALVNMLGLVKGQYPAVALQKLLSIRQDHPQNAGVAAQIGLTYAAMNNFNDARRYLNIAMGIEPENAQHLYNIAVVFDREGVRDKAIEYYDKALRVDAVHGGGRSINREVIYDRLAKLR